MNLGTLFVQLKADTSELQKGIREGAEAVEHVAKRIKRASREIAMVGVELAGIGAEAVHAAAKGNPEAARAIEELKGAFERIASEIGMAVLPVLKEVTGVVQKVADWFQRLDPHVKFAAVRFAAFVAAGALAIGVIGELSGVVAGLAGFVSILAGVISLPFLGVVAAVLTVIAVVVVLRKAFHDGFGKLPLLIQVALAPIFNMIDLFKALRGYIGLVIDDIKTGLAGAFEAAMQAAATAVSFMVRTMLSGVDKILSLAEKASSYLPKGMQVDYSGAHQTIADLGKAASPENVETLFKGAMGDILSKAKTAGSDVLDAVVEGLKAAKNFAVDAGGDAMKWIAEAFEEAGGDLAKLAKKLAEKFHLFGGSAGNALSFQGPGETFKEWLDRLKQDAFNHGGLRGLAAVNVQTQGDLAAQYDRTHPGARPEDSPLQAQRLRAIEMGMLTPFEQFRTFLSDEWVSDAMARMKAMPSALAPLGDAFRQLANVTKHAILDDGGMSFGRDFGAAVSGFLGVVKSTLQAIGERIAAVTQVVGQGLANALINSGGTFGKTMQAAMQGMEQGGPLGAVAGVITTLLTSSKAFEKIVTILNSTFQLLADVLGSILTPIEPLLGAIYNVIRALLSGLLPALKSFLIPIVSVITPIVQLLAMVLQPLAPMISLLAQLFLAIADPIFTLMNVAMPAIFEVMKGVGIVILVIARGIAAAWDWILNGVIQFLGNFGVDTSSLKAMLIDQGALLQAQQQLTHTTLAQASASAAVTAAQLANAGALDKATDSLTNVPDGFKVALRQFQSITPGLGNDNPSPYGPGYDAQGNPILGQNPSNPQYVSVVNGSEIGGGGSGSGSSSAGSGGGSGGSGGGGGGPRGNSGQGPAHRFAIGAHVFGPTFAMLGEGGEDEWVVPRSKLGGFVAAHGGGGDTVNIYANIYSNDPEAIWSKLEKIAQRKKYQRGFGRNRGTF